MQAGSGGNRCFAKPTVDNAGKAVSRSRAELMTDSSVHRSTARGRTWSWLLAGLLCFLAVGLHLPPLLQPILIYDDFQILAQSYTWDATLNNLGLPHNEHVMPLGRLSTWLVVQLAGHASALPLAAGLQGPLAVVAGMLLLFLFVGRERGHPVFGLIAMAVFGVSTQYRQAVNWFAASFAILALNTILLALLAAQQWRQTGRWAWLVGSAVASGLAPGWFASGILAGPLCALYLLLPAPANGQSLPCSTVTQFSLARRLALAFLPLLGTATFLGLGVLRKLDHIMHLEHWQGKTASEAFHPIRGLEYTAHSLIDNLVLDNLGVSTVIAPLIQVISEKAKLSTVGNVDVGTIVCPLWVIEIGGPLLALLAVVWWWLAPSRSLVVLGTAMVLVSYWLTYSARAEWSYQQIVSWGRYQLFPQLGLALFVAGGIAEWHRWGIKLDEDRPSWKWTVVLIGLLAFMVASQLPRAFAVDQFPRQKADLHRIDTMDARCREHHIAAATAREVLEPFDIEGCGGRVNGWDFLHGSPDPRPISFEDARRILHGGE
jgi:hypothetical protein